MSDRNRLSFADQFALCVLLLFVLFLMAASLFRLLEAFQPR